MYRPELIEGFSLAPLQGYAGPPDATVGVRGVSGTSIGFNDALLGRHVLFLGGIGTGKTVGMTALVESMRAVATPADVFVFFDTKGDYIERFYRPGDVSLSGGSGAEGGSWSFPGAQSWNLFAELVGLADADLIEEVAELTSSLLDVRPDDHNRIWTAMAQDLLGALIVAYVRSGRPYTNADIRAMADKLTIEQMRRIIGKHSDLRGTLQYIAKDSSNTTISVLIFMQQAIRQVFSGAFKRRGQLSVRQFLRDKGGRALFLEFDVSRGATLTPVYRTLLDIALKESLGRDRAEGRVFVVLDEFALLPRLRQLDAGLNFGRSLGMRFVVGTQNVGQVHHAYSAGLADSVLSGFGTVFAFRLYDQPSRDFVGQRFGANRTLVRYDAALKTRGVAEQLVEGRVVQDWDLTGLQVGQAVVGLPDGPPVTFTFQPPL